MCEENLKQGSYSTFNEQTNWDSLFIRHIVSLNLKE